jgi:hypothetical protein
MLTHAGRSYAARLGGSLLHAIGLPELVMRSARTYEDKAVLAGKPQELARLRRRLAKNRDKTPLFDTPALVRHLEQLYLQVARGALQRDAAASQPDASLPLVSILIPAGDDATQRSWKPPCAARWPSTTAAAKSSSATAAPAQPPPQAGRAAGSPSAAALQPGASAQPADNLDHCLTLALGDYIAVAPPATCCMRTKSAG